MRVELVERQLDPVCRSWKKRPELSRDDPAGARYLLEHAAVGGRVFAVTADGAGTQTMRTGEATRDAALELVATEAGAGRPMAAVPTAEGEVDIFSDRDGRVGESRFGRGGRVGGTDRPDCGCAGEIVAIRGRPGAWLEIDADTVRVHGL